MNKIHLRFKPTVNGMNAPHWSIDALYVYCDSDATLDVNIEER